MLAITALDFTMSFFEETCRRIIGDSNGRLFRYGKKLH